MSGPLSQTLEEIWLRFDYGKALADLNPRITSRRIYVRCPRCNHQSGWVLPGQTVIRCNRENNCGSTSILAHLIGLTDPPTGEDFKRAVREACKITGVTYPESQEQQKRAQQYQARRTTLDTIWQITNEAFQSVDPFSPSAGYDHLRCRGFRDDFIALHFGYLADPAYLAAVVDTDSLRQLGYVNQDGSFNERWKLRIIIPARDAAGKLVGLIGRTVDPACPPGEKYRYVTDYAPAKFGGFGLDTAKQHKRIILMEGILDVLKARQEGIENAIAAGTNNFGIDNLVSLADYGVREVVAALDADAAGGKGLWSVLNAADQSGDCPEVFVFDNFRGTKDPDEFLARFGRDAFLDGVNNAAHGLRYRARAWRDEYDFTRDGQLTAYIDRCTKYGDSLTDKRARLRLNTYFLPEVAELTGVDLNDIKAITAEQQQKTDANETVVRLRSLLENAAQSLAQGSIDNAIQMAQSAVLLGASASPTQYVSKIPMGSEIIGEVESDLRKYATKEYIGIPNCTLPTLDRLLLGLRGFIILAGSTNVGKTILLGQLALDCVRSNEDVCVLFLTLEMSRKAILHRMWSNLAGTPWVELKDAYREGAAGDFDAIWAARAAIDTIYRRNIRIWHPRTDHTPAIFENIKAEIEDLKRVTGRQRCMVIVDYLDVLPTPPGLERATTTEIEKVLCDNMLDLKEIIGEDNPVLAVSEMRKRKGGEFNNEYHTEDMMGSARKGYASDADLLWNRYTDMALLANFEPLGDFLHRHNKPLDVQEGALKKAEARESVAAIKAYLNRRGLSLSRLHITKVRDGGTKGEIDLTVDYRRNRIVEGLHV